MCVWWIFHLLMSKAHVRTSNFTATFGRAAAEATEDFGHKASRGLCKMYENTDRRIAKCASKGEGPQGQAFLFQQGVSIAARGQRRAASPPNASRLRWCKNRLHMLRCKSAWNRTGFKPSTLTSRAFWRCIRAPPPPTSFPTYNRTKV